MEKIYSRNSSRQGVPFRRIRKPISLSESLDNVKKSFGTGIISEFKRKSPSGFSNSSSLNIETYFKKLSERKDIAGFSVLTEPDFFDGSYEDMTSVQHFNKPILDKDFISTREMVLNAYNSGADAILLILDFLDVDRLYLLADYAATLGMESLIEFHDIELMGNIHPGKGRIFGYNRRNLVTLKMDPHEENIQSITAKNGINVVLESGIDSDYLRNHDVSGYRGLLIGTSILQGDEVQSPHPGRASFLRNNRFS